jgi:hypothetical protein
MDQKFSCWFRWCDRGRIPDIIYPGVYLIARSRRPLSGTEFSWIPEIIYVGMTNSQGGLKARLYQFDGTIRGMDLHGGAHRVKFKYPDYSALVRLLYVSVCHFECDVRSFDPMNLRIMGKVASLEYECLAQFAQQHGTLPEFNDKKRSPKK